MHPHSPPEGILGILEGEDATLFVRPGPVRSNKVTGLQGHQTPLPDPLEVLIEGDMEDVVGGDLLVKDPRVGQTEGADVELAFYLGGREWNKGIAPGVFNTVFINNTVEPLLFEKSGNFLYDFRLDSLERIIDPLVDLHDQRRILLGKNAPLDKVPNHLGSFVEVDVVHAYWILE